MEDDELKRLIKSELRLLTPDGCSVKGNISLHSSEIWCRGVEYLPSILSNAERVKRIHISNSNIGENFCENPNVQKIYISSSSVPSGIIGKHPNLVDFEITFDSWSYRREPPSKFEEERVVIKGHSNIKKLKIVTKGTISLVIEDCPQLSRIEVNDELLTELKLRNLPSLNDLKIRNSGLDKISLSGIPNLVKLDIHKPISHSSGAGGILSHLDLRHMPFLKHVSLYLPKMTKLLIDSKILENLSILSSICTGDIVRSILGDKLQNLRVQVRDVLIDHTCNSLNIKFPDLKNLEITGCNTNELNLGTKQKLNTLKFEQKNQSRLRINGHNISDLYIASPSLTALEIKSDEASSIKITSKELQDISIDARLDNLITSSHKIRTIHLDTGETIDQVHILRPQGEMTIYGNSEILNLIVDEKYYSQDDEPRGNITININVTKLTATALKEIRAKGLQVIFFKDCDAKMTQRIINEHKLRAITLHMNGDINLKNATQLQSLNLKGAISAKIPHLPHLKSLYLEIKNMEDDHWLNLIDSVENFSFDPSYLETISMRLFIKLLSNAIHTKNAYSSTESIWKYMIKGISIIDRKYNPEFLAQVYRLLAITSAFRCDITHNWEREEPTESEVEIDRWWRSFASIRINNGKIKFAIDSILPHNYKVSHEPKLEKDIKSNAIKRSFWRNNTSILRTLKDFLPDSEDGWIIPGALPMEFLKIRNISELVIRNVNAQEIPTNIFENITPTIIDFSYNKIKSVPEIVINNPELKELYLRDNKISQLPEFPDNSKITHLVLDGNNLTKLPESITNLKHLKVLIIDDNFIRKLPEGLAQLPLEIIYIDKRIQDSVEITKLREKGTKIEVFNYIQFKNGPIVYA